MIKFLFGNNLNTLLSANIDESATILTVSTGTGVSFPNPNKDKQEYFAITLSKNDNDDNTEICFVTVRDGDKFTVLRGQENTSAQKWDQGTKISNRITAEPLNQIKDKADQSYVDDQIGSIDFNPYYKKAGDTLTGAMHTNGNYLWGGGDKTCLIGQDDSWFIQNSKKVTLISFENGSITLHGQYSSFSGGQLKIDKISNNNLGMITVDANADFTKNIHLISNVMRPNTGARQSNQLTFSFQDDPNLLSKFYNQENVGESNNLIAHVKGGDNEFYYVFDNFGKFNAKSIDVISGVNADSIQTNHATIQDNNLTLQSNNITTDNNRFIHGNGIHFNLLKRNVNGDIYLQENPGIDTALVFQAAGGGQTSSMGFNNAGLLSVAKLKTNNVDADTSINTKTVNVNTVNVKTIKNSTGTEEVTFDAPVYFQKPFIAQGSFKINYNDLLMSSNSTPVSTEGYRNTNALKFKFEDNESMYGAIYFQEHTGTSNKLIFNVAGGAKNFNYSFDNMGTINAQYFTGVAAEANYADLAEYYRSDQLYDPGTIVKIGGDKEITTACKGGFFLGVVSTNPAFLMNTSIRNENLVLPIALAGRVPVKIVGEINKGDPITLSEVNGIAMKANQSDNIIGFSLEDNCNEKIRLVECSIKSVGNC